MTRAIVRKLWTGASGSSDATTPADVRPGRRRLNVVRMSSVGGLPRHLAVRDVIDRLGFLAPERDPAARCRQCRRSRGHGMRLRAASKRRRRAGARSACRSPLAGKETIRKRRVDDQDPRSAPSSCSVKSRPCHDARAERGKIAGRHNREVGVAAARSAAAGRSSMLKPMSISLPGRAAAACAARPRSTPGRPRSRSSSRRVNWICASSR